MNDKTNQMFKATTFLFDKIFYLYSDVTCYSYAVHMFNKVDLFITFHRLITQNWFCLMGHQASFLTIPTFRELLEEVKRLHALGNNLRNLRSIFE